MDNMKYYNESLAYDFERFMPRTTEDTRYKDNIVKLPQTEIKQRQKTRAAARRLSVPAFSVMASVFVLAALCGNIFLRLQINEVNSEINKMEAKMDMLQSEKTSLEVEFDRRISYENIELEATALGMRKMSKDQVKYIRVNDKNAARTASGEVVEGTN